MPSVTFGGQGRVRDVGGKDMAETCRCGAPLLATVTFCVECGASAASRPMPWSSGGTQPQAADGGSAASGRGLQLVAATSSTCSPRWSAAQRFVVITSVAVAALLVAIAFLTAGGSATTTASPAPAGPAAPTGAGSSPAPLWPGSYPPPSTTAPVASAVGSGPQDCSAQTTAVFTRLANGQITMSQAQNQLPPAVPAAALTRELQGVRRLQSEGASAADAISQAAGTLAQSCP